MFFILHLSIHKRNTVADWDSTRAVVKHKHEVELFKHSADLFKLSAHLLVFS